MSPAVEEKPNLALRDNGEATPRMRQGDAGRGEVGGRNQPQVNFKRSILTQTNKDVNRKSSMYVMQHLKILKNL